MFGGLAFVSSEHFSACSQPEENLSAQWMPDSGLIAGLPQLDRGYCQCLISNLTGNSQQVLIIGQDNAWTVNQYPFLGYYWNGSQWVSNSDLVRGLTAYPNRNDPTVGFNVTGDNTFVMIVGQWFGYLSGQGYGPAWTGYAWNGSQWVVNSTIIRGLPTYHVASGGSNFATLGYNVLGDGKWGLIVDNYGNNGYVGFEWNGTTWTQVNNLVSGLPSAGTPSTDDRFPIPCLSYNFANDNTSTLIVGLTSGGGPNGSLQGFQWGGTAWVSNPSIVGGVSGLQPWTNCPTVAYNVTGDGNWVLLVGSAKGPGSQPFYYAGYYWSDDMVPLSVSINPLSVSMNAGQSLTFNSTVTGGTYPYKYQWYVNGSVVSGATTNTWNFTPTTSGTFYIYLNVSDSTGNIAQSTTACITTVYFTQYEITFNEEGIGPNFNGTVVVIDGLGYTKSNLPVSFSWGSCSTHTFTFKSPLLVGGNSAEQYDWVSTDGFSSSGSNTFNTTAPTETFNVTGPLSVTGNYISACAVPINRVQGNCQGKTLGNSLTVNMTNTPAIGDELIAIISMVTNTGTPAHVNTITEAGVTWMGLCGGGGGGTAPGEHGTSMELWVGKVGVTNASKTLNVELSSAANLGATMDVCEYNGILNVDCTATKGIQSGTKSLSTGVGVARANGELAVGGIFDEDYALSSYYLSNASNGFTLMDGGYDNYQSLAFLEKINCPMGQQSSIINVPGNTKGYGCIAIFSPTLVKSNVTITEQETENGVLAFTASGPSGQTGYVNATIPVGFNSTNISVYKDRIVQHPIITTDGSNYFVYLEFHLSTHSIAIQYAGENELSASISPSSANLAVGQSLLFTATPSGGSGTYSSYQWYVNGSPQSGQTGSTFSFTPVSAGSYSITATVTDDSSKTSPQSDAASVTVHQLTITVTQTGNGVIAPGTTNVNYGSNQTFTITPHTGYHTVSLTVDGSSVTVASAYTFTKIVAAHNITASFALTSTPTPTPSSAGESRSSSTTSTPTPSPTPTASPTPEPTPKPSTVSATTETGATVELTINGNITSSQMSSITIATNQSAASTKVSFTLTGTSSVAGFGNVTIPKSVVAYGTTPTIYIDGKPAPDQGFTQDANNYYVWYTTHFSTHQVSIVFTSKSSSSLPLESIYGTATALAVVAIFAVAVVLRKNKKGKPAKT
jgi:hypothetical protein